jgi:hypothetical protein
MVMKKPLQLPMLGLDALWISRVPFLVGGFVGRFLLKINVSNVDIIWGNDWMLSIFKEGCPP